MFNLDDRKFTCSSHTNPEGETFWVASFIESEYFHVNGMGKTLDEARTDLLKTMGELKFFEEA